MQRKLPPRPCFSFSPYFPPPRGGGGRVAFAGSPPHGAELWHLVSVADQAMYNAKALSPGEAANDRAAYVEAAVAS